MKATLKSLLASSLGIALIALIALAPTAGAATFGWSGSGVGPGTGTGTNWLTAGNWTNNAGTPGSADIAFFGPGGSATSISFPFNLPPLNSTNIGAIVLGAGSTVDRTIGNNSTTAGILSRLFHSGVGGGLITNAVSGRTLTLAPFVSGGSGNGMTNILLASGVIEAVGNIVINTSIGEAGGARTITKTGNGTLTLGNVNSLSGKMIVNAGTLAIGDENRLGNNPAAASADTLTLNGATLTATAAVTIDDANRGITLGANHATLAGGQNFTFSRPITGPGNLTNNSTATLILNRTDNTYTGRTILRAGTTRAINGNSFGALPGAYVADQIIFENNAVFLNQDSEFNLEANRGITIASTGGRLQSGFSRSWGVNSVIAGPGVLTIAGDPTPAYVRLNAANTFTNELIVNNNTGGAVWGLVAIHGSLAAGGLVRVTTNGWLLGTGVIHRSVVATNGATIGGGEVGTPGTLTINGSLNLTNAILSLDEAVPGTVGSGINDLLQVNGDLRLVGSVMVRPSGLPGTLAPGTYRLINYTGALTGSAANLVADADGYTVTFDTSTVGEVNMTVSGTPTTVVWKGTAGPLNAPVWDVANLPNFAVGVTPSTFLQGQKVLFDDTGLYNLGAIPLSIIMTGPSASWGSLLPASVTVDSSTNVTLTSSGSSGKLGGTASVTKRGTGIFTMTTGNGNFPNDYTGPTTVEGGILRAGYTLAFGATNAPTIATNGGTVDLNGQSLGAEPFIASGAGVGGNGAIINLGGGQNNALRYLTLAGDTTVGGTGRWDVRDYPANNVTGARMDGEGFTLTKVGANQVSFVGTGDTDLGDIIIQQGFLNFEVNSTLGRTTDEVTVMAGATLGFWGSTVFNLKWVRLDNNARIFKDNGNTTNLAPVTLLTGTGVVEVANNGGNIYALNGEVNGPGGLGKVGVGIVQLAGTNTYSGNTIIGAGTLQLMANGSFSNSPDIEVRAGTTLDVNQLGAVGGLFLNTGQTLRGGGSVAGSVTACSGTSVVPGTSPGTLSVSSNLVLNGASLTYELNTATTEGGGVNDLINARDLTLAGTSTLTIVPLTPLTVGSPYTLMRYTNTLTGGAANLNVVSGSRYTFAVDTSAANLVRVTPSGAVASLVWAGGTVGSETLWNVNTTPNWLNGGPPDNFFQGDAVTFNDSSAFTSVNLVGALSPGIITVASGQDYTFGGAGEIKTLNALNKSGVGRLTLAGNNTELNGGITISAGTLQIGAGGASGGIGLTAGITNNATLVYTRSDSNNLPNLIRGSGALVKAGSGVLSVAGANAFAGPVMVQSGTLRIANASALGSSNNLVSVNSGGQIDYAGVAQGAANQRYGYTIGGYGPDGRGAVINSGNTVSTSSGLSNVTLSADAAIGTHGLDGEGGRIDMGAGYGLLDGGGFRLVKLGSGRLSIRVLNTISLAELVVSNGLAYSENADNTLGTNISVYSGGAIGQYSAAGLLRTNSGVVKLEGGTLTGGGQTAGANSNVWTGPIYVNQPSIFNAGVINGNADHVIAGQIFGSQPLSVIANNNRRFDFLANNDGTFSGAWNAAAGTILRTLGSGTLGTGTITNLGTIEWFNINPNTLAQSIYGSPANGVIRHTMGAGALTFSGNVWQNTVTVQNGDLTKPMTLLSGADLRAGTISVGITNFAPAVGSGRLNIDPGASVTVGSLFLGDQNFQTGIVAQAGGTVTITNQFRLSHYPNNVSTYTLDSGSITMTLDPAANPSGGGEQNGGFYVGIDGVGILTQNGGTITTPNLVLDNRATSVLGTATNTYTLNGGTLTIGRWGIQSPVTTYQINLGGGIVAASQSWTSALRMTITGVNGNTTINPGANTITLNGALVGSGGLVKEGAGTLLLNNPTNSFAGGVTVNAGTLGGHGAMPGPLVVAVGGTFAPGTSPGVFTVTNDVTLSGTTLMEVSRTGAALTNDRLVVVSGALAFGGTLTVTNLNQPLVGGEVFDLFDFNNGLSSGTFSAINLPALATHLSWDTSQFYVDGTIRVTGPPCLVLGPASQTAYECDNVRFTGSATNLNPFDVRWRKDGVDLAGATSATLVLTNVQLTDAGTYTFSASNSFGETLASATLTVLAATNLQAGLIAWWPLDEFDAGNNRTVDATTYAQHLRGFNLQATNVVTGIRSNAFNFNGNATNFAGRYHVGGEALPANQYPGFTVAMWVRGSHTNQADRRVFAEGSTNSNNPLYGIGTHTTMGGGPQVDLYIRNNDGSVPVDHRRGNRAAFDGAWHHVALVDNNGSLTLYVDGILDTNLTYVRGTLSANTVAVGGLLRSSTGVGFIGDMDDVMVWRRVLKADEVVCVMTNSLGGAPVITLPPASLTVDASSNATFTVTATSYDTIRYQWYFGGSPLAGETGATLSLTATPATAGNYTVVLTNCAGAVTSAVATLAVREWDFGDAPAPYPTLLAANGARHLVVPGGVQLGANIDAEADGQPIGGTGDDSGFPDDEDGVFIISAPLPGQVMPVAVDAPTGGKLDGWIDFDANGNWTGSGEQIFSSVTLSPGINFLNFTTPANAALGLTYARFRLSTVGGLAFDGPANDGEVEDYPVTILAAVDVSVAKLDAPDPVASGGTLTYTLVVSNAGPNLATGITLDDTLPSQVAFVSGSPGCTHSLGTVTCNVPDLAAAGSATVTIVVTVNTCPTTIANTASVSANESDTAIANNSTTAMTTVVDQTAPVISVCATNANLVADASCQATIPDLTSQVSATDNCSAVSVTQNPLAGTLVGLGATNVTLTVRDAASNAVTCVATLMVVDQTAPDITACATNRTVAADASCQYVIPDLTGEIVASDCNGTTVAQSPAAGTLIGLGATNVTFTVTDGAGNASNCVAIVTVTDQTAPAITTCAMGRTLSADTNGMAAIPDLTGDVTATDNCGGVTVAQSPVAGTLVGLGMTNVTLTATDAASNSVSCVAVINVIVGTVPPSITMQPASQTVECSSNVTFTVVAAGTSPFGYQWYFGASAIANATNDSLTFSAMTLSAGSYRVVVTNDAGSATSSNAVLTVVDTSAPVITCPTNVTVQCDADVPAANFAGGSAADACDASPAVVFVGDVASGSCPKIITRTYAASDASGNTNTCTQTITVHDTTAPMITCPAPAQVECFADIPAPDLGAVTAMDNCSTPVKSFVGDSYVTNGCIITVTRIYDATDACGNTNTCAQTILVVDTTAPMITCPAPAQVECFADIPAADLGAVTAMDNCSIPAKSFAGDSYATNGCVITVTRTYMAADACGNTNTCAQTITVQDTTAPMITCPAPAQVECFVDIPGADLGAVMATDNCSTPTKSFVGDSYTTNGCVITVTRTYMAADACGNTNTCGQIITVRDTTPPAINCPASFATNSPTTNGVAVAYSATATDNCTAAPVVVCSPVSNTVLPLGTTTVTCSATDACGNSNACSFVVTVYLCEQVSVAVNISIPDGLSTGRASVTNITSLIGGLTDVNVTLNVSGGWNGDLYAYLVHDSGFAVLLNRAGKRAADSLGYDDAGFNVTLDDQAANGDIHSYRLTLSTNHNTPLGGPLTGTWAPDGRTNDPANVLDTHPRTDLLGSFNGLNPNGEWVLFVADDASGDISTLVSWSLELCGTRGVPPSITTPPASQTVECKSNVTFTVSAAGTQVLSYQWYFNNGVILGATSPTLTLNAVTPARAGNYSVRITNDFGSISVLASLTVVDTLAPSITCPTNVTVQCDAAVPAANFAGGSVADACDPSPVVSHVGDVPGGSCPKTVTRTYLVVDASGNSNTCAQIITVHDLTPPSITCPTNLTVQCLEAVPAPNPASVLAMDNCDSNPVVTHVGDVASGTCPTTITRTYKVTDACGNTNSCTQTITVHDTTAPAITCSADILVLSTNLNGAPVSFTVTATDNCTLGASVNCVPASGSLFAVGTNTVACAATDACGNSNACSFTITVLFCQSADFTVNADVRDNDVNGLADTRIVSSPIGSISDLNVKLKITGGWNGDLYGYLVHDSGFAVLLNRVGRSAGAPLGYDDAGLNVTLDDQAANGDVHVYQLAPHTSPLTGVWAPDGRTNDPATVLDTHLRPAQLGAFTGLNPNGRWTLFLADIEPSDTSRLVSWGLEFCGPVGAAPVIITQPFGRTLECGSNALFSVAALGSAPLAYQWYHDGTVIPGATSTTLALTGVGAAGAGNYTVTVSNPYGNVTSVVATLTVVDTVAPVIVCLADKTVECGDAWTFDRPGATDICDGTNVTITVTGTITNAACGDTFTATRTWKATDGSGNFTTCSQMVTVRDTTPPTITCALNKTVECGDAWTFDRPGAADICSGTNVTIAVTDTTTNNACGDTFIATRTWVATDACGNPSAACSQTVTVVDSTVPTITCVADKTVECGDIWTFDRPGATDICSGTNVTITVMDTITNGLCGNTFIATRTWKATDICSNAATCSQTVTVRDTTPPMITCVPDKTVECGDAWTFDRPGATDLCGGTNVTITVTGTTTNAQCGNTFTATRVWTATDGCGNTSLSCSQTVTVRDTTPPTITCPAAITVQCDGDVPTPNVASVTASDLCGPAPTVEHVGDLSSGFNPRIIVRTYRATDACSNRVDCTQTITVRDTVPPVLNCSSNIVMECTSPAGAIVGFTATGTDNCDGAVTVTCLPASGALFPLGNTLVRCSTADASGNTNTCTFTVRVVDTVAPVFCAGPVMVFAAGGTNDNFTGPEPSSPSTSLLNLLSDVDLKVFDDGCYDTFFAHSFANLPANISEAVLRIKLRACDGQPENDSITMGFALPSGGLHADRWSRRFGTFGAVPGLLPYGWGGGSEMEFVIDLARLPNVSGPATDLIPRLNALRYLDFYVQDDTLVDYVILEVKTCQCQPDMEMAATPGLCGAVVNYTAPTFTDNCDANLSVTCSPPSGSLFRVGATIVACTAVDDSGNRGRCSFNVTVTDATVVELHIQRVNVHSIITWNATCTGEVLEQTTSLQLPATWTTVSEPVQIFGGIRKVIVPNTGQMRFFRVRRL